MLLDLVEVARSHSGVNLAATFAKVLEEFGISDKVRLMLKKRNKYSSFSAQILGITADNALNNDKMIEHLATLINTFPGAANQTRCFAHILNLVAKSVLRQFEVPKVKGKKVDDAAKELAAVIDELDDEVSESGGNEGGGGGDDEEDDDVVDDNEEGLPDERDGMSEEELTTFEESVKPIRLVLSKVISSNSFLNRILIPFNQLRGISLAIKNSSTIVLPQWYEVLKTLALSPRMMPRDVSTRWNSTYDMVEFTTEYRAALDIMTADCDMKLRQFELSKKEWSMVSELCEVLRVRFHLYFSLLLMN
jgi:hypothetical protein